MAQLNYSDFYQVPDLKFDIKKLSASFFVRKYLACTSTFNVQGQDT